jgi:drug/metabolite transporter (DMT)-like permease
MHTMLVAPLLAKVVHGGAVPLIWVIGIVLIVCGVVALVRGRLLMGVVLIVIGIFLGGLNVF